MVSIKTGRVLALTGGMVSGQGCRLLEITVFSLVGMLLAVSKTVSASDGMLKIDGILSGNVVELVSGREILEHRSKFWMSKLGMVVETEGIPGKSPHLLYLYNYREKKSWIVSPKGRRYCLVPDEEDAEFSGGILSTEPCLGYESQKLEEVEWNKQPVAVWQCTLDSKNIGRHFYSSKYGLVVKEEGADGVVREVRWMKNSASPDEVLLAKGVSEGFTPVEDYRAVTVSEFFFAKRPLEKYLE